MKKVLSFFALSFLLASLASCDVINNGVGGTDYFKEYTFTGTANNEQSAKIYEGLQKSALTVSSIITKTESRSKSGSNKTVDKSESTLKFYEDANKPSQIMLTRTSSGSTDSTSNGITLNRKTNAEYKQWDGGSGFAFSFSKTTNNGILEENSNYNEITMTSEAYKGNVVRSYVSLPESSTYYINSDGSYTVINSRISKQVSGVQWGNGTKEYITASKTQTVYSISKDYKLTKYYSYEEQSSNRDQTTGEWFSSEQVYYRYYTSKEYKYGKRESASVATYNALVANKVWHIATGLYSYNASMSDNMEFVEESNQANSISCSDYGTTNGVNTYRFIVNVTRKGSYDEYYFAKRFVFGDRTLYGADRLVTNEYDLVVSEQADIDYSVYSYYNISNQNGHTYFTNIGSSSYYNLEIFFTFDGSNAIINSIYLYY